jgi:hypothetical protein
VFWVISVYFNIRNTLPKSCTFLLEHSVSSYENLVDVETPATKMSEIKNVYSPDGHFHNLSVCEFSPLLAVITCNCTRNKITVSLPSHILLQCTLNLVFRWFMHFYPFENVREANLRGNGRGSWI